jgi:RNA polymerase sigma factor (TIGR02999 family)
MTEVTRIFSAIEQGDPHAAEQLLPLVYDELRRLAAQKLAHEKPGQTLQATALVHEAYLRLVASGDTSAAQEKHWDSRRHFFAAAAEAMRRILVDEARRKRSVKHGGGHARVPLDDALLGDAQPNHTLLEIDELLEQLAGVNSKAAELVKLRFFAGLTGDQTALVLDMSPRSVDLLWAYARAWLFEKMQRGR